MTEEAVIVQASKPNRPNRFLAITGLAIVVVLALVLVPKYIAARQVNQKIAETVAMDQALMVKVAKFDGKLTYANCIDTAEKAVDERNRLVMDLKGFKPGVKSPLRDEVLAFMTLEDDICRTRVSFINAVISFDVAGDRLGDLSRGDYYSLSGYLSAATAALRDHSEDSKSLVQWADTYLEKYDQILKAEVDLSMSMSEANIGFSAAFSDNKTEMLDYIRTYHDLAAAFVPGHTDPGSFSTGL